MQKNAFSYRKCLFLQKNAFCCRKIRFSRAKLEIAGGLQGSRVKSARQVSQEKRKFSGRMSRGHRGVIRADVQGQKLQAGPRNLGKTSTCVRTSMTRLVYFLSSLRARTAKTLMCAKSGISPIPERAPKCVQNRIFCVKNV